MTDTNISPVVGFVVACANRAVGTPAFVATHAAAVKRGTAWDRKARRWYGRGAGCDYYIAAIHADGSCTAGGDGATGLCGMGIGGSLSVGMATEFLRGKSNRWLRSHGISID